ncbi:MAG: hypothetical protein Q8L71_04685 [Thiobacillus sp.]|nr:hypothetical protein [Thiobacillus sp.]
MQGDNLHALKALLPRYAWKLRQLRPEAERVRAYVLTESWSSLLNLVLSNASHSTS